MAKEKEKAIQITELKEDLGGLIRQAQAINGAIQYIQQKMATLSEVKEDAKAREP